MKSHALRFLASRWPRHAGKFTVNISPLAGGLESAVARVEVEPLANTRLPIPRRLIVKELRGTHCREDAIYRALWRGRKRPPAARMFGSLREADTCYLYLEELAPDSSWPWRDTAWSATVCRALARLHCASMFDSALVPTWDYERELARSALDTLALATTARAPDGGRYWERLGDLQRVVATLPRLRADLMASGVAFIHGDVHPGNVVVSKRGSVRRAVFIDWARARLGSPLEDIASWLHSLGCWEPEARRRHDTLLRVYLRGLKAPDRLEPDLRRRLWFASVSNGLAGAIAYHLSVLSDAAAPEAKRGDSLHALQAWQRVVRRAAELLGSSPATTS